MKNRLIIMALFALAVDSACAQSLERQVIGSAGVYASASWGSLSTTVGEGVISTATGSSVVLTQGFQQPLQADLAVYDVPGNDILVKVFPVPASDVINVEITGSGHYNVSAFDMPGRRLPLSLQYQSGANRATFTYDVHSLAAGAYLLLISDEHGQNIKTVKFTKIN